MPWTAHIDGGSRGNPGPAAAGVVLRDESGHVAVAAGFFLGRATNNQAEYNGLLRALDLFERAGAREIEIVSDSELMVRQINGQYKVRSPDLRPLFEDARTALAAFRWRIRHVLRAHNTDADGLANDAMDAHGDVVRVDTLGLLGQHRKASAPRGPGAPAAVPAAVSPTAPVTSTHPRRARQIEGRVTEPPAHGQCPAGMRQGQVFRFECTTPPGLCLHLCATALPTVLQMQQNPTVTAHEVKCSKPRCGAVLQLAVTPG